MRDEPRINLVRLTGGCGGHTTTAGAHKGEAKGRLVPSLSVVATLSWGQRRRRNRQEAKATGGVVEAAAKEVIPAPEQPRRRHALYGDGDEKKDAVADSSEDNRQADLLVCGCWSLNTDCLVDFVVTNVNQPSYKLRTPATVLRSHEQCNEHQYLKDCIAQHRKFTPFAVLCKGMIKREVDCFINRITMKLAINALAHTCKW